MSHHLTDRPRHHIIRNHLLLGAVLLGCALILLHWPSTWPVIGSVAVSSIVLHAGAALLAGIGILIAALGALWSRTLAQRDDRAAPGATIRWARFYDWLVAVLSFGREARVRERTLDIAGVVPGEQVLDVGCGTGTLALAARRRVGARGTVHGVDAAAEMIARARAKSARRALPVTFDVAAAQALPFADSTFDVVLCTLALHHLPEDARAGALAEMRRVLKAAGRAVIVEIGHGHGIRAALNPVTLLHGRETRHMLDDAAALMHKAGFGPVDTGPLGSGVLGYARARRDG